MKRFVSIILAGCLLFSISACSASNDVSLDTLTAELNKYIQDEVATFDLTETDKGYSFSHTVEDIFRTTTYSGTTDKNKNLRSLEIVNENIEVSILSSKENLEKTLSKSANEMTKNDIGAGFCILQLEALGSAFGVSNNSAELLSTLYKGSSVTFNGWTIKVILDEANQTVTISAIC